MYTIFRPFYIIAFLSVVLVFGNAQDSQSIVQLHPTYSQTLDILADTSSRNWKRYDYSGFPFQ